MWKQEHTSFGKRMMTLARFFDIFWLQANLRCVQFDKRIWRLNCFANNLVIDVGLCHVCSLCIASSCSCLSRPFFNQLHTISTLIYDVCSLKNVFDDLIASQFVQSISGHTITTVNVMKHKKNYIWSRFDKKAYDSHLKIVLL